MDFTPAQRMAIDTKKCSLLVAAGAGSGKTRVLTERIIDRLLDSENKTDITKFLIVTFTNAAAKELSERIRLSLTAKSAELSDNTSIVRNLALLPQAKISTIDSFCYDLVKEHYQKLGLLPKLRIAEETETDVILIRILKEIIEEKMSSDDDNKYFLTVYELLSDGKKDDPFLKEMKHFYEYLLNLPSIEGYLDMCCDRFLEVAQSKEFFDTEFGRNVYNHARDKAYFVLEGISAALDMSKEDDDTYKKFLPVLENDIDGIKIFISSLDGGFKDAAYSICSLKHKTLRTDSFPDPEFAKKVYSNVKIFRENLKELKDTYFSVSGESIRLCAEDCYNLMSEIRDIMLEVDKRFSQAKKAYGILTFSDVERLALSLLYDDTEKGIISETAKALSKDFDELYIDEYQDINPVQDMIFRAVAKNADDGKEHNRFLVGDVKQSIYGFRGARPEIFDSYRESFDDLDVESSARKKLFMRNNFRCSESVIAFTNMLFEYIMPEAYSIEDKLIYSRKEEFKVSQPVKLLVCNCNKAERNTAEVRLQAEAQMLFGELMSLIDNPEVLGSDGKTYSFSDAAILTQTWDAAVYLEKYLAEKGVPVVCERGESFFARREVLLAINIIESVDNPERDIATAGFMRSASGGFDDDELTQIRLANKTGSFFSAVQKYTDSKNANSKLACKIQRFLELHSELRSLSRNCSASDFIRKMYAHTDLISICTSDSFSAAGRKAAGVAKKNLMRLYDMAREYDKTVFKGISSFIEYLSTKKTDSKIKSETVSTDGVRIMTIHKSKGLEFPICFVFGADRELKEKSGKLVMNDILGTAFKINSMESLKSVGGKHGYVKINTPFREIVNVSNRKNGYLEDKRLLYVALTRAKDRLVITACPKNCEKLMDLSLNNPYFAVTDGVSELHWILSCVAQNEELSSLMDKGSCSLTGDNGETVFTAELTDIEAINKTACEVSEVETDNDTAYQCDKELLSKIKYAISQADKAKRVITVPQKLTVTLLKHGLIEYEDASGTAVMQRKLQEMPEFVKESSNVGAAEKGTAMHTFLQFADYANCENDGCQKEAERLEEYGFITQRQKGLLDIAKLDAFFETQLYLNIKNAQKVYREMRFNLKLRADEVIADIPETDDFVLVQGVIDCFIENKDGSFTVIDFKTDNVNAENGAQTLHDRYFNQLSLYCRAVEDITKKKVSGAVIFSFALMDCVPVEYESGI